MSNRTESHSDSSTEKESSGEGFLSRWSRLKKQSSANETEKQAESSQSKGLDKGQLKNSTDVHTATHLSQSTAAIDADENKTPVPEESEQVLTDEDMPDLNTLDGDSDYTGFLSPGVSEELRKLALRKLFGTEQFHFRDGLDDYDEEFTHFEKLGDIITADMRFQMEQEAKSKLKELAEEEPQDTKLSDGLFDDEDAYDEDFEDEIDESIEDDFEPYDDGFDVVEEQDNEVIESETENRNLSQHPKQENHV